MPIRTPQGAGLTNLVPTKFVPEPPLGGGEPGRDGAFGRPEGGGDLPVGVAVVVSKNDEGGIARWKAPERIGERHRSLGIVPVELGATPSPEHLAHPAQTFPSPVGARHVERDAVDPRFGRRLGFPAAPRSIGADESLLSALLGGRRVAADPGEREEDPLVAVAEQPVEVLPLPWSVRRTVFPHLDGIGLRGFEGKRAGRTFATPVAD